MMKNMGIRSVMFFLKLGEKKGFPFLLLSCLFLFLTTSCTRELIVAEVLQLPIQSSLYTRYNLWFTDPMEMDSLNMLKGEILPFGTEVEVISATDRAIHFIRVSDRKEFKIYYTPEYRMLSAEDYLRSLFSDKNESELTVGIHPLTIEKIKAGIVETGMTRKEIELALGEPCAYRTPSRALDTWCYWTDYLVGKRIIFFNGRVIEILVL